MSDAFDLVVIGSGPGGYVAAIRAAQLGLKTAIVERAELGGVCLNWGCIPTKALLKSGEVFEQLGHLSDYGLKAEGVSFDFAKVVERSRKVAAQLNSGVAFLMKKHKIEVVAGAARLDKGIGAPLVKVALNDKGVRTLQAKAVIRQVLAEASVWWSTNRGRYFQSHLWQTRSSGLGRRGSAHDGTAHPRYRQPRRQPHRTGLFASLHPGPA